MAEDIRSTPQQQGTDLIAQVMGRDPENRHFRVVGVFGVILLGFHLGQQAGGLFAQFPPELPRLLLHLDRLQLLGGLFGKLLLFQLARLFEMRDGRDEVVLLVELVKGVMGTDQLALVALLFGFRECLVGQARSELGWGLRVICDGQREDRCIAPDREPVSVNQPKQDTASGGGILVGQFEAPARTFNVGLVPLPGSIDMPRPCSWKTNATRTGGGPSKTRSGKAGDVPGNPQPIRPWQSARIKKMLRLEGRWDTSGPELEQRGNDMSGT